MKRILSLIIFISFIALKVYGFDPVFLSNLYPESLVNAKYNYTVKNYNGSEINGVISAKIQDNNGILVTEKIGQREKKALIKYSQKKGGIIDAFYIYNDKGERINFYKSSHRNASENPNKALDKYKLIYRKPNSLRTLAGTFAVIESKYERHETKQVTKNDLRMITDTNSEVIVDEYHGFPVNIFRKNTVLHKIVNLRDTTMVIPNKNSRMQKIVKIEITSYEENH